MKILFIGGTRFVGRAMAAEALARGHKVDLFHRGRNGADLLPGARHLLGDRDGDLAALAEASWDATIDVCAYRPHQVQRMAEALGARAGHYVLVSSISVYAERNPAGADETAPRADTAAVRTTDTRSVAIDAANYGPLKAMCEDEAMRHFAAPLLIRPTYVFGAHDPTERFAQWVRRIAAGGSVDAPEPRDEKLQFIDARDLAAFTVGAVERALDGAFNVAGDALGFGRLLEAVVQVLGPPCTTLRWLTVEQARASDQGFPLWGEGEHSGLGAVGNAKARAQGLQCRPLVKTIQDVRQGPYGGAG